MDHKDKAKFYGPFRTRRDVQLEVVIARPGGGLLRPARLFFRSQSHAAPRDADARARAARLRLSSRRAMRFTQRGCGSCSRQTSEHSTKFFDDSPFLATLYSWRLEATVARADVVLQRLSGVVATSDLPLPINLGCADNHLAALRRQCFYLALLIGRPICFSSPMLASSPCSPKAQLASQDPLGTRGDLRQDAVQIIAVDPSIAPPEHATWWLIHCENATRLGS